LQLEDCEKELLMSKMIVPFMILMTFLAGGALIGDAMGQTSTSPGIGDKIKVSPKTVQTPVPIPGIPSQFDLETRVGLLEREVGELRLQVRQLAAQLYEREASAVGPSGRLTPLTSGDDKSDSEYSGPRLKVPADKKGH
jgi:hypothetical protein